MVHLSIHAPFDCEPEFVEHRVCHRRRAAGAVHHRVRSQKNGLRTRNLAARSFRRRVAATPRLRRGYFVGTSCNADDRRHYDAAETGARPIGTASSATEPAELGRQRERLPARRRRGNSRRDRAAVRGAHRPREGPFLCGAPRVPLRPGHARAPRGACCGRVAATPRLRRGNSATGGAGRRSAAAHAGQPRR